MVLRTNTSGIVIAFIVGTAIFLSLLSLYRSQSCTHLWNFDDSRLPEALETQRNDVGKAVAETARASNATLGFEKIFVVGLRERSDRRDAMAMQTSLTGLQIEWVDGVKGEEIPTKVLPPGLDRGGVVPEAYLGSWRGHMNAVRRVLDQNLASALIMEDDVDWDIRIRSQMVEFAKGVRSLTETPATMVQHSAYGDNWDILWPGHCGEVFHKDDEQRYVIKDDETVAPTAHQPWLIDLKDYPEHTRIIHKTGAPICTFAYAVSTRGAQKILASLALKGKNQNLDNALSFLCRDGVLDLKCYSVQPTLFFHHRPVGSIDKDSDMTTVDNAEIRPKGYTENIVWSTRLNLEKLVLGATDYVMQW